MPQKGRGISWSLSSKDRQVEEQQKQVCAGPPILSCTPCPDETPERGVGRDDSRLYFVLKEEACQILHKNKYQYVSYTWVQGTTTLHLPRLQKQRGRKVHQSSSQEVKHYKTEMTRSHGRLVSTQTSWRWWVCPHKEWDSTAAVCNDARRGRSWDEMSALRKILHGLQHGKKAKSNENQTAAL